VRRHVCIVGCGAVGASLAEHLSHKGIAVVIIDRHVGALDSLEARFGGHTVVGDATELAVLERAEAGRADLLVAVTDNDSVNLMVAQVAQAILAVPRVLARVNDGRRAALFRELGVPTICTTDLVVSELLERASFVEG